MDDIRRYEPWPTLAYNDFKNTGYLLHRIAQIIGKLKLSVPFEPHWANVALWITCKGLTTGPIPYQAGAFSVEIDCIDHVVLLASTWGARSQFPIKSKSVSEFTELFFDHLKKIGVLLQIYMVPQEVPNPIPFDEDTTRRNYDPGLANAWWRILVSVYKVMQRYHGKFDGETPSIGLMWGTFDLRDARYNGQHVPTTGINAGYIRRNAMNEAQVETGFWPGNPEYTKPAFFSFFYPKPEGIENQQIQPKAARWDATLGEFILDYDDLLKEPNPDQALLDFFESTYSAGAKCAKWDKELSTSGVPV